MYAQKIPYSGFVDLCFGVVVSESLSHFTHTSYFLSTSLTTLPFTRDTITNPETHTFIEVCSSIPTCIIISNIFSKMEFWDSLHNSLLRQGMNNKKSDISAVAW